MNKKYKKKLIKIRSH